MYAFFIMYDITSNKVRKLVAKYLEKKGCTRVQRSIFLADLPAKEYEIIKSDLVEVQAAYDNNDSILIIPISIGYLDSMKIIGQDINIDLITHKKNRSRITHMQSDAQKLAQKFKSCNNISY